MLLPPHRLTVFLVPLLRKCPLVLLLRALEATMRLTSTTICGLSKLSSVRQPPRPSQILYSRTWTDLHDTTLPTVSLPLFMPEWGSLKEPPCSKFLVLLLAGHAIVFSIRPCMHLHGTWGADVSLMHLDITLERDTPTPYCTSALDQSLMQHCRSSRRPCLSGPSRSR